MYSVNRPLILTAIAVVCDSLCFSFLLFPLYLLSNWQFLNSRSAQVSSFDLNQGPEDSTEFGLPLISIEDPRSKTLTRSCRDHSKSSSLFFSSDAVSSSIFVGEKGREFD